MKMEKKRFDVRRMSLPVTNLLLILILQVVLCAVVLGQTSRESVDLIISSATVVTMDAKRGVYEDGSVAVKGDSIVAVGLRSEIESRYRALQTIDGKGRLLLPGFVNGHTHVPMTLFRGLHDDVTLNDWLYKYIFPAEAKNVNEEFVRWGTRLAAAEQIRAGVTTFADMYYFEDAVAEETKAAGMRGVLGETFIDFPAPDNKSEAEMLAYTERFLKKWQGDPLIHAAPAPHSIYTCSKKTLQESNIWRKSECWGRMWWLRTAFLWTRRTGNSWRSGRWDVCTIRRAT